MTKASYDESTLFLSSHTPSAAAFRSTRRNGYKLISIPLMTNGTRDPKAEK